MTEAERKPRKKIVIQQLETWIDLKDTFLQQINAERWNADGKKCMHTVLTAVHLQKISKKKAQ